MWIRLWAAVVLSSTVIAQHVNTRIQQGDGNIEWGWQLAPQADGRGTAGHYYVKLPQSEQRVRYTADGSGYHSAVVVNTTDDHHTHTSNVAVGQRALELNEQQNSQVYHTPSNRKHQSTPPSTHQPSVDIYLLQRQFTSSPSQSDLVEISPTPTYPTPYITPLYNIITNHQNAKYTENEYDEDSKPLKKEETEQSSPVRVFKNHNCSRHSDNTAKESVSEIRKTKDLYAEIPSYDTKEISGNFGAKEEPRRPITYRGAVHYRVEAPRPNARNERYYYATDRTPTVTENVINVTQIGIDKLVASTQDLISNEDLLRINHAIEKYIGDSSDDIIKPKSRFTIRTQQGNNFGEKTAASHVSVKTKAEDIVKGDIQHYENDKPKEQVFITDSGNYKFVTPIIVQDSSYNNAKEQIVNNLVSTMVPYIANGYQIIGVRDTFENTTYINNNQNPNDEIVNVTPRPIGQNYLTPITVALRLLNSNGSEELDSVEDHETSDSELVADTVDIPKKEKTIVEIQESIPVEITHINDVEVHEYLDEGRSNQGPFDVAQSLYNKYIEAIKWKKQQDDAEKAASNDYENDSGEKDQDYKDGKDNLEPSENVQSEVEVKPEEDASNERSEYVQYYNDYNSENQKIIQPIIIEKEVPVTKFVDRFIEKQVPYPERVEVPVPVDRPVPVAVPVEKLVEKPVEVTRYVDKPYPVEVPRPYPVEIKVPYPVEQKVYIDRPVHIPYPIEKVVEKPVIHPVPIPTPVGIPLEVQVPVEHKVLYPITVEKPVPVRIEVEKPIPVEKIVTKEIRVPYPVEKKVPYPVHYETKVPVPYPVEKKIHVPVEKIVEKPVTVTKIVEKPVHIEVPVPRPVAVPVHVPHPYPVDRIVEKKVPYPVPVDRIVEKKVHVQVPYPVEKIVEKIVEKPVVFTKYIDRPYPVERRVPYPVEKVVEKRVPYPVQVPVEIKVPYPVEKIVEKPVNVPVAVYHYNMQEGVESRNNYQYQKPNQNQPRQLNPSQTQALTQYYQQLKERQKLPNVQSTHWGNFANYQNNTIKQNDLKKAQALQNYINYLTNTQYNAYQNYGAQQNQNDYEKNKNYVLELKLRRTDRVPKMTNLRIEYGGFKPPLIPSTEVDLDGIPVNKQG